MLNQIVAIRHSQTPWNRKRPLFDKALKPGLSSSPRTRELEGVVKS